MMEAFFDPAEGENIQKLTDFLTKIHGEQRT